MKDTFTYSLCKICHNGKFHHTCKIVELTEKEVDKIWDMFDREDYGDEPVVNKLRKVLDNGKEKIW